MPDDNARELYDLVVYTTNLFLRNAKTFNINILSAEDPTYEALAELVGSIGKVVYALYEDHDPHLAQKAFDYCDVMKKMGLAILAKDELELSKQVAILESKPLV